MADAGVVGMSLEDGVIDSLCDVAIREVDGFVADYFRYFGRFRYLGGEGAIEEATGTVGSPSIAWRLAEGSIDEGRWSVFPRRGSYGRTCVNFPVGTCGRRHR